MERVSKTIRESNIELLRIIAIFMVLVGHSNGLIGGLPNRSDFDHDIVGSWMRLFFSSCCLGGVNIFILISGWFGIRPSRKGLSKFLFEFVFLLVSIFFCFMVIGGHDLLSLDTLKVLFGLTKGYWFIMAYLGLYLLSPILNVFVEHATKRQFQTTLICFYFFQSYYSWLTGYVDYFEGYSIILFCGLYLTTRYLRRYPINIFNWGRGIFLGITVLITIICAVSLYKFNNALRMLRYDNPLEIIACVGIIYWFSTFKFQSRWINKIAASCFAVYIYCCPIKLGKSYFPSVTCCK